jgi:phospholipase D1/2
MIDPLIATFYHDVWHQVAENNTKIYRQVFRCMPDSEVLDWRTYEKFNEYNERFMQSQGLGSSKPRPSKEAPDKSGPPGSGGTEVSSIASMAGQVTGETRPRSKSVLSNFVDKLRPSSRLSEDKTHTAEMHEKEAVKGEKPTNGSPEQPDSRGSSGPTATPSPKVTAVDEKEAHKLADQAEEYGTENPMHGTLETSAQQSSREPLDGKEGIKEEDMAFARQRTVQYSDNVNLASETTATQSINPSGLQHSGSQKRRRRGTTKSSARAVPEEVLGREEAEELLKLVQGHLVLWPYEWYVHFCLWIEVEHTNVTLGLRRKSEVGTGCIISTSWRRWKYTIDCCCCCTCVYCIWTRVVVSVRILWHIFDSLLARR